MEQTGLPVLAVSASRGDGLADLRVAIATMLPSAEELAEPPEPSGVVVHRFDMLADGFAVSREQDAFRVRGRRVERVAAQTDFDNEESAARFQRDLARMGIDQALRREGIEPGDTVRIGELELEWEPEAWEGG
jgi:GTP-binding protein